MEIVCPTCNTSYKVPADKVASRGETATCKNCGGRIDLPAHKATDPGWERTQPATARQSQPAAPGMSPSIIAGSGSHADNAFYMDFPELKSLDPETFALDEIMTPDKKGKYSNRPNKHKVKLLIALRDILPKIVKKGERVVRVGQGVAHYPMEMLFGNGVFTMIYNQYAILCTDRRVLFVNINCRVNRPTHYLFQMAYEDIAEAKTGMLGGKLLLRRGMKKGARTFTGMKRYFTKELAELIRSKMSASAATTGGAASSTGAPIENLCPACFAPLETGLVSCTYCQAGFKEPRKAFLKSLAMPGWGDLYLGHKALGSLELVGSLVIWAIAISNFLSGDKEAALFMVILLIFYNGIDGMVTYHMAKKGYMIAR